MARVLDLENYEIIPTFNRVLVKIKKVEEKTAGGLYLAADTIDREKLASNEGVLVALGEFAFSEMSEALRPKVGDQVFINMYPGLEFEDVSDEGVIYRICQDKDILTPYRKKNTVEAA